MSGFDPASPPPTPWRWRRAPTLARFRADIPALSLPERQTLVDTAMRLLADYYVHLPQKQASHGVDPLARLRWLRRRLPLMASDAGFHAALAEVFDALLDLHTNYILPSALAHVVAFLPLQLGEFYADGRQQVIVTRVAPGFADIAVGEEVAAWSGMPILRALEHAAAHNAGANAAAQRAHALVGMTMRPLAKRPPPDEDWVAVQLRRGHGAAVREVRAVWRVLVLPARDGRHAGSLDVQSDALRRGSRRLFNTGLAKNGAVRKAKGARLLRTAVPTELPRNFAAAELHVGLVRVGYLRIPTFVSTDADAFVAEFARLLALLPGRGLILDVRDNGGGLVEAAERSLQLLTPGRIEPAPMQLRATPAVLALCRSQEPSNPGRVADLSPWRRSVEHALDTGAMYSAALPMTSPEACNAIGQRYHGPVVLLTSALCYSATDIFAAGFQDHAIGPVLGVHSCTGAGGANVWPFSLLQRALAEQPDVAGSSQPGLSQPGLSQAGLPQGAELRVAFRRSLRVGLNAGLELEERGVVPDVLHDLTRRDLLDGDPDLIAHAACLLEQGTPHPLDATLGPGRTATIKLGHADRLDVLWNGRPMLSRDVAAGQELTISLPGSPPSEGRLGLRAYEDGVLVAARDVDVGCDLNHSQTGPMRP